MATRCLSLVEQKRLQWAKEREEMAGMCAPWGPSASLADTFRSCIRTHYMSSSQLSLGSTLDSFSADSVPLANPRRRSPSLPPIRPAAQERDNPEEDLEAQTSGYGSDYGGVADSWPQRRDPRQDEGVCGEHREQVGYCSPPDSVASAPWRLWPHLGAGVAGDDASRLRWGDRGVGVGHLWEPSNTLQHQDCRLPQVSSSGSITPGWLERGLSKMHHGPAQVLVIRHPPGTSGSGTLLSPSDRTFLRGQNIPLEPDILLEREQKRQKALEHQRAIQQQVEEREKRRQEEKKKMLLEEQAEEERIRKVHDEEMKRREQERQLEQERLEKESRRLSAMREALEAAERLAKEEKVRSGRSRDASRPSSIVQPPQEEEKVATVKCKDADTSTEQVIEFPETRWSPTNTAITSDVERKTAEQVAAVVLGSASDQSYGLQPPPPGVQLALLMSPASMSAPILLSPSTGCILGEAVVESRVLTPSKYRLSARNQSTQTEQADKSTGSSGRRERKKSASLERPHRGCKLPLRCRSQSQSKAQERPKWGVNRPGRQYVKQSERDPFYQRRLRQKQGHRHDDHADRAGSRSPSPQGKPWTDKMSHRSRRLQIVVDGPPMTPTRVARRNIPCAVNSRCDDGDETSSRATRGRVQAVGEKISQDKESPTRMWPVADILLQLSSLRQGLVMKQLEWQPSRSQTPFSDASRS